MKFQAALITVCFSVAVLVPNIVFAGSEISRRSENEMQLAPKPELSPSPEHLPQTSDSEEPTTETSSEFEQRIVSNKKFLPSGNVEWGESAHDSLSEEEFSQSPYVKQGYFEKPIDATARYGGFLAKGKYSRARSLHYGSYANVKTGSSRSSNSRRKVYYTSSEKNVRKYNETFATINNSSRNPSRYGRNVVGRRGVSGTFGSSSFATLGRNSNR